MSNLLNWLASIIGGLVASLVAIVIWEKYRQPKLIIELSKEGPSIQPLTVVAKRAFYHLLVKNIGKSPAYYCKIFMRFYDEKGINQIIPEVISGKWDRGPEPLIYAPDPHRTVNQQALPMEVKQTFLIPYAEVLDIHNNITAEGFCPIIKYENESEFYAFSVWSYIRGQGHKVPEWKIGFGRTVLEIELIFSGKRSQKQRFLLENQSTAADGIKISKIR